MAEKMKPSGIDWIGDVPENWYMIKLKYFSYLKGRIGWQGLTADEFIDEGPYLITGTDFENGNFIAYFPEIAEQQAIADFLDKECARIDSIAADLEKQIHLYF